jgi:opacity protein-like surface antigen
MTRASFQFVALFTAIGLCCALSPALAQQHSQTAAQSEAGLGFRGIGATIGFVDPENVSSAVDLGFHVDAGQIVHNVHLIPSVSYWNVGTDVGAYHADVKDFAIATDVNVDFPLQGGRLTPYLGGGLGLNFLSFDSNAPGGFSSNETKLGLNVLGGMRNDVMPNLAIFGELRYSFVTDANQLKVLGGFTYKFIY